MKRPGIRKKLKRVARLHALVSGSLMAAYIGLSVIYSPDFFLSDVRNKFQALATNSITIAARVLGPPVKPVVTVAPLCASGVPSVVLEWADDENSTHFDIDRGGMPLVGGVGSSEYRDGNVGVGMGYSYIVTAYGPMGSGSSASDPVTATIPVGCGGGVRLPSLSVAELNNKDWKGSAKTTSTRPLFEGTTSIPNAKISIAVHSSLVISASTTANANGYWKWRAPVDIPYGPHTIFVKATDPQDSSITVSTKRSFRIVKVDNDTGETTDASANISAVNSDTPPDVEASERSQGGVAPGEGGPYVPFDMDIRVASPEVYQGRVLSFAVVFGDVADMVAGAGASVRYSVIDDDFRELLVVSEDIVINKGASIPAELTIPSYFKEGRYRVRAEILVDGYDVSTEREISVIALPVLSPGGGFIVSYSEFLSALGVLALVVVSLLLLWVFVFSREYMLSLRALRHITERNLARSGFFGRGKGV